MSTKNDPAQKRQGKPFPTSPKMIEYFATKDELAGERKVLSGEEHARIVQLLMRNAFRIFSARIDFATTLLV
jgi:hypothetical protein